LVYVKHLVWAEGYIAGLEWESSCVVVSTGITRNELECGTEMINYL